MSQNRHNAAASRNPNSARLFAGLQGPRDRRPQVPELGPEPPQPADLIRPQKLGFGRLGEGDVVHGVPPTNLLRRPALVFELLPGVLPDGLQHPVARSSRLGHHQRLVHQPVEEVKDAAPLDPVALAHGLRVLQRPTAREYREPPEQDFLGLRQKLVAPVERRPQGPVARLDGPAAAGEEPQGHV